jgi:hypothetical protein
VLDVGDRPLHVEPRDPYPWPEQSTSAHEMTERAMHDRPSDEGGALSSSQSSTASGDTSHQVTPMPNGAATAPVDAPASSVTVNTARAQITRGERLDVAGSVSASAAVCDHVRVDLWLLRGAYERHALGTLMTDGRGHFSGSMVVPFNVPVGDYDVEASTPGRSPSCGPGRSQR